MFLRTCCLVLKWDKKNPEIFRGWTKELSLPVLVPTVLKQVGVEQERLAFCILWTEPQLSEVCLRGWDHGAACDAAGVAGGPAWWAQGALPGKCLIPSSPVGESLAVSKSVPTLVSDASIKLAEWKALGAFPNNAFWNLSDRHLA